MKKIIFLIIALILVSHQDGIAVVQTDGSVSLDEMKQAVEAEDYKVLTGECSECWKIRRSAAGVTASVRPVPGSAQSGGISPDPLHLSLRLPV